MIDLSVEQRKAYDSMMDFLKSYFNRDPTHPYFVLSGVAGSGKTSILGLLYNDLIAKEYKKVAVLAFTGRAASVLRRKGIPTASTIHSFLYKPIYDNYKRLIGWKKKMDIPEEREALLTQNNCIIIDESSMVSEKIFMDLIETALPILFVGDSEQLPPVEDVAKNFELMQNHNFLLTEIHRQAWNNPIIKLSKEIRENNRYDRRLEDIQHIKYIRKYELYKNDGLKKIYNFVDVILCRYNKTRMDFNNNMRALLGFSGTFATVGETIICLKNDLIKDLMFYNGERFEVVRVSEPFKYENTGLMCREYDLKSIEFDKFYANIPISESSWDTTDWSKERNNTNKGVGYFTFGYVMTTHKAQGSEFSNTLFIDEGDNRHNDQRRFRYTAVTRAKERIIIGL
jgi:exodeoxyribonuclease-5